MHVSYLRKTRNILASTKDKEQRRGDGGTEEQKDRTSGIEKQKSGHWDSVRGEQEGCETGYKGRETRNREVIQRTKAGRQ